MSSIYFLPGVSKMDIFYRSLLIAGLLLCSVTAQTVYYSQNFEGTPDMTPTGGGWKFGTPTVVGPQTIPEESGCKGVKL
jgi:hypothetical protein